MLQRSLKFTCAFLFSAIFVLNFVSAEELDPALETKAKAIFEDVFSPFCPGRSLNDCPSTNAHELKDQIRSDLKAGKEPEVILQSIFTQYGEQYRALPKPSGIGIFAWALPGAFVGVGLIIILLAIMRKKNLPKMTSEVPASKIDPKMAKEIEAVLRDSE